MRAIAHPTCRDALPLRLIYENNNLTPVFEDLPLILYILKSRKPKIALKWGLSRDTVNILTYSQKSVDAIGWISQNIDINAMDYLRDLFWEYANKNKLVLNPLSSITLVGEKGRVVINGIDFENRKIHLTLPTLGISFYEDIPEQPVGTVKRASISWDDIIKAVALVFFFDEEEGKSVMSDIVMRKSSKYIHTGSYVTDKDNKAIMFLAERNLFIEMFELSDRYQDQSFLFIMFVVEGRAYMAVSRVYCNPETKECVVYFEHDDSKRFLIRLDAEVGNGDVSLLLNDKAYMRLYMVTGHHRWVIQATQIQAMNHPMAHATVARKDILYLYGGLIGA